MPRPTADRRALMFDAITQQGQMTVAALAEQFGLSEVSVRRNLEQLESAGLIRRTHGGAEAVARPGQPSSYHARLFRRIAEKEAIGAAAAALIRPGETVLLDSGTTVIEVARALPADLLEAGGLTVITRSLVVAGELRQQRGVRLVVLGGIYQHDFDDFVGPQVEAALNDLHVTTAVIGTDGIDALRGLTTENLRDAGLLARIARAADRLVVVADSSKIGVVRLQSVLPLAKIQIFVTDAAAPQAFVDTLEREGVRVILAPATFSRQ